MDATRVLPTCTTARNVRARAGAASTLGNGIRWTTWYQVLAGDVVTAPGRILARALDRARVLRRGRRPDRTARGRRPRDARRGAARVARVGAVGPRRAWVSARGRPAPRRRARGRARRRAEATARRALRAPRRTRRERARDGPETRVRAGAPRGLARAGSDAAASPSDVRASRGRYRFRIRRNATRRDSTLTRPPPAHFTPRSRATQGIEEDHAHEQFFYDDATTERLVRFAKQYERPLFLCTPSLAAAAARMTAASSSGSGSSRGGDRGGGFSDYLLLDRDARWEKKLPKGKFRRFDLASPRRIGTRFSYDAVFCDPPFANVALRDLRRTIDLLATDDAQRAAPLWLCFVADREADVMDAFEGYELERKPPALGYRSVRRKTQERIFLYGPRAGGTRAKAPSATEAGGSAGDG